jgi:streptogramin lyase
LVGATLLLSGACAGLEHDRAEEDGLTELAPLTVPVPSLQQFVVLSSVGTTFGQRCTVSGGDVGVAASTTLTPNTLLAGIDSHLVIGRLVLAPRVVLGDRVAAGEIGTDQLSAPPSVIIGPVSPFIPPPLVPTPSSVTAGGASVNVNAGQTSTLAAGRFGAVTVMGRLNLSGGLYEFQSLRLSPDARLVALGASRVRIATTLSVADRARITPAAPLTAGNMRLIVAGADGNDNSITLGVDARLSALTLARRTLRAADRAIVAGSIAARRVIFGNDARVSFDTGFECSSSSDCDDRDACTLDACADAQCSHAPASDGTACDDRDACTLIDACQSGHCTGASPRTCPAADQCHAPGSCDPSTGVCSNPSKPDGVACDDEDPCSLGDQCQAGSCSAGTELRVTEFATGLVRPRSLVAGLDDDLWIAVPESVAGASDGSLARVTSAGAVTKTGVARDLSALLLGPDGKLWVGERILGALPALGRYDTTSRRFIADYVGIHVHELAASNDGGSPIIWFTGGSSVGRITPSGELLASVPTFYVTRAITAASSGPSTVLWITEANAGGFAMVGRLAYPHLQQFAVTTPGELADIVEGPDGAIWFTDPSQNEIGRMPEVGGAARKHALPTAASEPNSICNAPDGNLWVTLRTANKLARMSPQGEVTEVCIPTDASEPTQIAVGPDGNVWFLESSSGKVGRIELLP